MKRLLSILLLVLAASAHAGLGLAEMPGLNGDAPVTVFYPAGAAEAAVQRGPFALQVALNAPPVPGNGRLVAISHGSGGAPWTYTDLARKLVDAGFVVVFPSHRGDDFRSLADAGPASWRRRPGEVSRAIDAVQQDARFKPLLAADRVGMYGMSAGGHTALTMAGGRWSPSLLLRHCEAHLEDDFATCVGLATQLHGNMFDGVKKAIAIRVLRHRLDDTGWYSHDDPRVKAVVAEVPFAVDFDPASLAPPRVPLGLVVAGKDRWLVPRFHSGQLLRTCTSCEVVADVPTAGHGSLMSPPPPLGQLSSAAADLLSDPPGFDRSLVPATHARIVAFFRKHLLP